MGALRKLGLGILVYMAIGVVLTILLLNDIISIHDGNILISILFMIFQPIILLVNFLYYTMPFLQ